MNKSVTALLLGLVASGMPTTLPALDLTAPRDESMTAAPDPAQNRPALAVPGGFGVGWNEQPPMIPHPIDKYSIDLRQNGCLKCHSPATYEVAKAPKVADSHFYDRDGTRLDHLAPRRYFCTQCHAPQTGAIPLVDNVFEGR